MWQLAGACSVAFLTSVVLCVALHPLAHRVGLIDAPSERKHHTGDVPLTGGLAMFVAVCAAVLILDISIQRYVPLFAGCALLVAVGLLDDLHELGAGSRFVAQILAALGIAVWGGTVLHDLGALGPNGVAELGVLAVPFTVFCTVGVMNAMNMSDGLDGLASTLALVALGGLALLAFGAGRAPEMHMLLAVVAAVAGFAVWNIRAPWRSRARVFMGDAGSLFLGLVLSWFLIDFSQGPGRIMSPATALWLFALPLMDTVATMLRRLMMRRSPLAADREHLHHILRDVGLSVSATVGVMALIALALAAIGILGLWLQVPEPVMAYGFLGLGLMYLTVVHRAAKGLAAAKQRATLPTPPGLRPGEEH